MVSFIKEAEAVIQQVTSIDGTLMAMCVKNTTVLSGKIEAHFNAQVVAIISQE